ncbi:ABC transporter ATP-binding protein [Ktedonospora formicarum]|uniref:ABC transporter ATP-binding protein n=1 Tax=Ktedonospora formicarum TaxID=2778364 RepID=A0A8J3MRR7_9CHLR|nr:ABC transporter ATP-binding protein [Ktedonospora formicarum]GHO46392.1 ABC transporter ATP-binding protein [Ktedonospora formicarum]
MTLALEASQLGKRYGKRWALRNCDLGVPEGSVTGLVGLNGAGKTTLMHLAMGLLKPDEGSIRVLGEITGPNATALISRLGFIAQERPLYKSFSVQDMLTLGRKLNTQWDQDLAVKTLERLRISLKMRVGKLSGGQQALLSLMMALAKRPQMLLLDEPFASIDPAARRDLTRLLMETAASEGTSILISSHYIMDLENTCDHLILLAQGQVKLEDDMDHFMSEHKLLIGPRDDFEQIAARHTVLQAGHTGRQSNIVVRLSAPFADSRWTIQDLSLEDIVLAYLDPQNVQPEQSNSEREEVRQ